MNGTILVTGRTGNVGDEVVRLLRQGNNTVLAAHRNPSMILQHAGNKVESVWLDFFDPASYQAAFTGVERVFLVRPPAITNVRRFIFPVVDAAKQAGVQHIVFLSLLGVGRNHIVPHYKIEQYILASGVPSTFLRPSFFMQNLNTTHRAEIKERSEIFVPAGKGKTSFVDVRDIAAVAALTLTEAGHTNRAYDLTGSEALDYYQVAAELSAVLHRPIAHRAPSPLQFIRRQRSNGTPWSFVLVMSGIYMTARLGLAGRLTDEIARLLGRPPLPLRQYAEDYRHCW